MTQKTEEELLAEAGRHIVCNRGEIEASEHAECISCCAIFGADEVQDWQDEGGEGMHQTGGVRWTAKCPRCGEPTVIGSCTGLLEDQAYVSFVNYILSQHQKRQNL